MPWPIPEGESDRLALAKGYPFPAPDGSYLFAEGDHRPLTSAADAGLFAGRTPVVAHGSNRSPEQLARKYGAAATIPVSRGWLAGYDVVYSAHITQYGSVASTLQYAPGTAALVSITWLDDAQLQRMHETEGPSTYQFGELAGIAMALEVGPAATLERASVYLSSNGCLSREGGRTELSSAVAEPIGLAAVTARPRPHGALAQEEALDHVQRRHRSDEPLDRMILRSVADLGYRQALVAEMKASAVPASAPHFAPEVR